VETVHIKLIPRVKSLSIRRVNDARFSSPTRQGAKGVIARGENRRERSQAAREFREDEHVAPSVIDVINAILGKNGMEDWFAR